MLRSRVMPSFLTWNAIAVFSEEYVEKPELCIRTLFIGSCKSEKRALLQGSADAAINYIHVHACT